MKYIKFVLAGLLAATLLTTTTTFAATNAPADTLGQWSLTLSGAGATTTQGDVKSAFGTSISLGRTGNLVLPFEAGVRQSVGFSGISSEAGSVIFTTRVYADWTLIRLGSLELLAGGSIGLDYGNQPLVWRAAPEVETRLWLKSDIYLFGRVGYGFVLDNADSHAEHALTYGLGVGVRL